MGGGDVSVLALLLLLPWLCDSGNGVSYRAMGKKQSSRVSQAGQGVGLMAMDWCITRLGARISLIGLLLLWEIKMGYSTENDFPLV